MLYGQFLYSITVKKNNCLHIFSENFVERSRSEETHDFLQQCEELHSLLQLVNASCSSCNSTSSSSSFIAMLQERCCHLLQHVEDLTEKVKDAGSMASGGIFEWVDSPLVVAIREGHWVVVEGASLCPPSVLDRLNPLLEPGGRLLLTERGVVDGSVPCVTPHDNFRIFLTIDHTYGEVSRAMRNRGVELFVNALPALQTPASSTRPSDSDEASQQGLQNDENDDAMSTHSADSGHNSTVSSVTSSDGRFRRSSSRLLYL